MAHLFSFAKNDSISLQAALETSDFTDLFHLPVSEEAMVQLNLFQTMLQNLLHGDGYDSWSIFGSSKSYKVSQLYKDMMRNDGAISALKWMWEGYCQQKHNVFFWLLTYNKLNTRAMLQTKNFLLDDYSCVMCGLHLETRDHLIFQCPFATLCC
jgi:hypothetical protein